MALVETRQAEFLLLEAHLPGAVPQPVGVFLHDPDSGRLGIRLRRDWAEWMEPDEQEVFQLLAADLTRRAAELGPAGFLRACEQEWSNAIQVSGRQPVLLAPGAFDKTLERLYQKHVPSRMLAFRTHLPVYTCRAAAGRWGEQMEVEPGEWRELPDERLRLTEDMFIAQVVGRSMEPEIPDGSFCVFRANVTGSRQGKKLLVENFGESEQGGQRYTVKRYKSTKLQRDDGSWEHARIRLEPLNPEFEPWELEEGQQCRVIGELVRVLD